MAPRASTTRPAIAPLAGVSAADTAFAVRITAAIRLPNKRCLFLVFIAVLPWRSFVCRAKRTCNDRSETGESENNLRNGQISCHRHQKFTSLRQTCNIRILVAEDRPNTADLLRRALET